MIPSTRARFAAITFVLCLVFGLSYSAEFSPNLDETLKTTVPGEFISAIIILESPVDIRALDLRLHEERTPLKARHLQVINALRYNADQTQPAFETELNQALKDREVAGFTAYWIENLFVVSATGEYLESLRGRGDLKYVVLNFTPELIEPDRSNAHSMARPPRNPLDTETTTLAQDAIGATRVNRELGITGLGTLVANLDTGVDGNHPALASRWRGNFAPASECWLDVLNNSPSPVDLNSHGTHVMGTITGRAISGNDTNTIGSAPNARWMACNAIGQGVGNAFDNDVLAAFEWFIDPDEDPETMEDVPDVVQNSWGVADFFTGYSECDDRWNTVILNLEAAGTVVTWSAGNEGPSAQTLRTPANYSFSETQIFAVAAVEAINANPPTYTLAGFSSRGPTPCPDATPDNIKPEIAAPGVNIYSSVPGGGYADGWSGTSMAGPHVAGVVALMREACPNCDPITIKEAILATALDQGAEGNDNSYGEGVIDAYEAVLMVSTLGRLMGTVTDENTAPLEGVVVDIVGENYSLVTGTDGTFELQLQDGVYSVATTLFGYAPQLIADVQIVEEETTAVEIVMPSLTTATLSGFVYHNDYTPVTGAEISVLSHPVDPVMSGPDGSYEISMPVSLEYLLQASTENEGFVQHTLTLNGNMNYNFVLPTQILCYDFESDQGWTSGAPGDNATSGIWDRSIPEATFQNGNPVQPGEDHTPDPGSYCWVTHGDDGGGVGQEDVDGGQTTLLSPIWDLSEHDFVLLEIWSWYSNDEGTNGQDDALVIDLSNDGGTSWTTMLNTEDNWEEWRRLQFGLSQYLPLTDAMQIRVVASDYLQGSLVEVAIDDVCMYVPQEGLIPPSSLTLARDGDNLLLTWDPVQGTGFYTVWKGGIVPATPQNSTIIAATTETSYTDTNISADSQGFYFITANP